MKFLIDTQLPPRLAKHLSSKGYDAIHTIFFPDGHLLDDEEIIVIAKKEDRTVISKDSDFLDNYFLKGAPPKVLLIEFGNISNRDLLSLFDQYFEEVLESFNDGSTLVVFRKTEVIGY